MNTARSVAYGWVALIVAAGGSYYYAKKDLKGRKMDPHVRESRNNSGNVTCKRQSLSVSSAIAKRGFNDAEPRGTGEDRLKGFESSSHSASDAQHRTESTGSRPDRPASRNHAEDVKMDSQPTGVDTSGTSAGARISPSANFDNDNDKTTLPAMSAGLPSGPGQMPTHQSQPHGMAGPHPSPADPHTLRQWVTQSFDPFSQQQQIFTPLSAVNNPTVRPSNGHTASATRHHPYQLARSHTAGPPSGSHSLPNRPRASMPLPVVSPDTPTAALPPPAKRSASLNVVPSLGVTRAVSPLPPTPQSAGPVLSGVGAESSVANPVMFWPPGGTPHSAQQSAALPSPAVSVQGSDPHFTCTMNFGRLHSQYLTLQGAYVDLQMRHLEAARMQTQLQSPEPTQAPLRQQNSILQAKVNQQTIDYDALSEQCRQLELDKVCAEGKAQALQRQLLETQATLADARNRSSKLQVQVGVLEAAARQPIQSPARDWSEDTKTQEIVAQLEEEKKRSRELEQRLVELGNQRLEVDEVARQGMKAADDTLATLHSGILEDERTVSDELRQELGRTQHALEVLKRQQLVQTESVEWSKDPRTIELQAKLARVENTMGSLPPTNPNANIDGTTIQRLEQCRTNLTASGQLNDKLCKENTRLQGELGRIRGHVESLQHEQKTRAEERLSLREKLSVLETRNVDLEIKLRRAQVLRVAPPSSQANDNTPGSDTALLVDKKTFEKLEEDLDDASVKIGYLEAQLRHATAQTDLLTLHESSVKNQEEMQQLRASLLIDMSKPDSTPPSSADADVDMVVELSDPRAGPSSLEAQLESVVPKTPTTADQIAIKRAQFEIIVRGALGLMTLFDSFLEPMLADMPIAEKLENDGLRFVKARIDEMRHSIGEFYGAGQGETHGHFIQGVVASEN